jgi:hypothetical protein
MGRKTNSTPSFIKSDGLFITQPFDVANYLNDYFVGKLRQEMHYKFEFCKVSGRGGKMIYQSTMTNLLALTT